jgi:competence protein ComEA
VYVSGAVREPAVYTLPPGAIVQQAITMAGGPADDAALDALNLARPLVDGEQVVVPRQGEAAPTPLSPGPTGDASPGIGLVNINTATLDELDTLPGVGPAIAQRIIDYRTANGPFQRIEDIQNVAGIGPATFEDLRDLIIVD